MNTVSSRGWRDKYYKATMQQVLRNALVAEAICEVDRSDNYRIQNPYSNQPTAAIQALTGTYSVSAWTQTDDTLTVTDEVIYGEHIFDFERLLNNYDLFANRVDEMAYAIATGIDKFVLNNLCEDATGTYTTPAGGFTTAANINTIMANLLSKTAGYANQFSDHFLVIENTDLVGFVQAQATNGFAFADRALNNGFIGQYMGVDIYVVRTGTFVDETIGTTTVTNSGHRVFGVKRVSTYATPRDMKVEEKMVTGKTGVEIAVYGYVGFKLWAQHTGLVVDITLA